MCTRGSRGSCECHSSRGRGSLRMRKRASGKIHTNHGTPLTREGRQKVTPRSSIFVSVCVCVCVCVVSYGRSLPDETLNDPPKHLCRSGPLCARVTVTHVFCRFSSQLSCAEKVGTQVCLCSV